MGRLKWHGVLRGIENEELTPDGAKQGHLISDAQFGKVRYGTAPLYSTGIIEWRGLQHCL